MATVTVAELVAGIGEGTLLAVPREYSGVAMEATRELLRAGTGGLRLLAVPTSGLQADVLIGAGRVASVEAAAIALGEAGLAPRFGAAMQAGSLAMRDSTCPAIHAALQAAEKGIPFMPLRGILGSDVLARRDDWRVGQNPFAAEPDPIVLLPALHPDVALFHAPRADTEGNVWVGRHRELATMAHAAARTLVTVEEVVDGDFLADPELAPGAIPAIYVTAIAIAPRGAWPLGLAGRYQADPDEIARYAAAARTDEGFARWLEEHLVAGAAA
jgi:glutaconate CoA-transferase, subunit A